MIYCNMAGEVPELALEPSDIENVTFGFYESGLAELRAAVAEVDGEWVQYFNEGNEFFCGFLNGELASFCITCTMDGGRTGDIGCVGARPAFRRRGIGLEMVKRAAIMLKERGCSRITVRKTGLVDWYGRLGFTIDTIIESGE